MVENVTYPNIREEELKNKIAQKYFAAFDCTKIIGNIDFCVTLATQQKHRPLFETESLLWAEAKKGKSDIYKAIVQLTLTIGKARTFDKNLPPAYLGAFDAEKIAFIPYNDIHDIFYQNDFNWNVTPSNHQTKEFALVLEKVTQTLADNSLLFSFKEDEKEINLFIKTNFIIGKSSTSKIRIDKNNFMVIYNKWLAVVKPTIAVNWGIAKKNGIIDGDFYLADILSRENESIKEKLFVLLKKDHYQLDRKLNESGLFSSSTTSFIDRQQAHTQFWNKYARPPKEEYWDYIVERRDLLVPQDVRERKGSFFTPQIWVELSQKYLTDVLGEDWQDEYYVWDCAAGTGNLLNGLTNKYNIWASTLDRQDVDAMKDRIKNGANLLDSHVFQFDFLNDDFSKLPESLQKIVNDSKKRKKLVVYINPPYVEGDSRIGKGRRNVQGSKIHDKYQKNLGKASGELSAQFFIRIYKELNTSILAEFSKLKILQAPNSSILRKNFEAKLEKIFIVSAATFDNVKGQFPIAFMIWNTGKKEKFKNCDTDIYNVQGNFVGTKRIYAYDDSKFISALIEKNGNGNGKNGNGNGNEISIGHMSSVGNDFQNQNALFIEHLDKRKKAGGRHTTITNNNLINVVVYFTVRKCIKATWLNDRDQFLYPNDGWKSDTEFQNDCLAYTLFSNNIQSQYGTNHWIPFTEQAVDASDKFESNFMTNFIKGKIERKNGAALFETQTQRTKLLDFSSAATSVFEAGKALWKYYHQQANRNVNASLYDIRAHFQGRNEKGRMNSKSADKTYMLLITRLRDELKILAKKIVPKVYEYGFLKG